MSKQTTRLPLNKQVIVYYEEGTHTGRPWAQGKYVSWWDIRDVCTDSNCLRSDEHCTFDGQIFYKKKSNA